MNIFYMQTSLHQEIIQPIIKSEQKTLDFDSPNFMEARSGQNNLFRFLYIEVIYFDFYTLK